jgi:hypothetical protein
MVPARRAPSSPVSRLISASGPVAASGVTRGGRSSDTVITPHRKPGLLLALGAVSLGLLAWWLVRRKRAGKAVLVDPDLFKAKLFRFGVSGQVLQQIGLGGTMIALPVYLQIVLEYSAMGAGLSIAPLSLSMFTVALMAGKTAGKRVRGWA